MIKTNDKTTAVYDAFKREPGTLGERKPPKGFEDFEDRKALALKLRRQIDAYNGDMSARWQSWQNVQDVYDGNLVKSSLVFIDDLQPYNIHLMKQRAETAAANVCDPLTSAEPYFVFKSKGKDPDATERAESCIHYALELAGFDRRIRDAALSAALKSRGVLRLRYETITDELLQDEALVDTMVTDGGDVHASEEWEVQKPEEDNVRYTGLIIDSFRPEDIVAYPTYAAQNYQTVTECVMFGHRFLKRRLDLILGQEAGRYFEDETIPMLQDVKGYEPPSTVMDPEDYPALCYDLIVKVVPPGGKQEKRYRITYIYNTMQIVDMEEYLLPTPWYFAPALRYQIGTFWPAQSIAEAMMELQTMYNDAWSMNMVALACGSFPMAAVTGYVGDASEIPIGIGKLLTLQNDAHLESVPNRYDPNATKMVIENCERIADTISRVSQGGLGGDFSPETTATAVNAVQAGQSAGTGESIANFGLELERMADLARFLLAENWEAFSKFHADAIEIDDPELLRTRISIELNGKSQTNSPSVVMQKLMTVLQVIGQSGMQVSPPTKIISGDGLLETFFNSLKLPVSTEKILQDAPVTPQIPGQTPGQAPDGQGNTLAAVLQGMQPGQGNIPPGGPGSPNPAMPGAGGSFGPAPVPNTVIPAPGGNIGVEPAPF